jgi:prepilin-type N-terminal cleavage/methylation domain-containing protein
MHKLRKDSASAFTLAELLVVIVVLGILATITVMGYGNWQKSITTTTIKSDLNGVASAMENAHTFGSNGYPTDINSLTTFKPSDGITLVGGSSDGGTTYCVNATSSKDTTLNYYISSTTASQGAQIGSCVFSYTLTTSANTGGTVNIAINGTYNSGTNVTITAYPSTYYSFSSWTGDTGCSGLVSHNITIDANKTCIANFTQNSQLAAPTTPTVTVSTSGSYTDFGWSGSTCSVGNVSYQYNYKVYSGTTISDATLISQSGWIDPSANPYHALTVSEGYTYMLYVQAKCSGSNNPTSGWSQGSNSYYRPYVSFAVTLGNTGFENIYGIAQISDGSYVLAGTTASYGAGGQDALIAKYTLGGVLLWSRTWGGTGDEYAFGITQTSDGGFAISGRTTSYGAGYEDAFIAKYTSDGTLSWSRTWGSGASDDEAKVITQTSDGGYVIAGNTGSFGAGNWDVFVAKYTSGGTLLWSKTWGGAGIESERAISSTSDGGFVIAGITASYGAGSDDAFIAKYTSSGTLSWSETWGGTGSDRAMSIIQTTDGGYAVTGDTYSYGDVSMGNNAFIAKYTSVGILSWSRTWGGSSQDWASSLIQTTDGGYVMAGYTNSYGAGRDDTFATKYTSDGTLSWSRTFGGGNYDEAWTMTQTIDGGFAMAGYTNSYGTGSGTGDYDALLVKYTPSGTITNCSVSICKTVSAIITTPSPIITSPSPTVTTPSASTSIPSPSITTPSLTAITIVAP